MFKKFFYASVIAVAVCLTLSFSGNAEKGPSGSFLVKPPPPEKNWKEIKYSDPNPATEPSAEEAKRGFVLFQRPIEKVVYSETKPLAGERMEKLSGFAAQGEIKVLTFGLFPLSDLENFNLKAEPLANNGSKLNVEAKVQTYWNVRYPHYNSQDTYRKVPELLEKISQYNVPKLETQRYWLEIKVPENAIPGIYRGTVSVSCLKMKTVVDIPVVFRVMPFKLKQDPAKHFSAFNYDILDRITPKTTAEEKDFYVRTAKKEYRTMQDYGIDTITPIDLWYDIGKDMLFIRNGDLRLDTAMKEGLKGPVPVHVCGIFELYQKYTGKSSGQAKAKVAMPPQNFFAHLTGLVSKFELERKAKGWPEIIYMPMDEISVDASEFGAACYKAVKAAGVRTWATKDPKASDANDYSAYTDFWCSQPFSASYSEIQADRKHGYWCYPNHNACEVRIPEAMCAGGRMTYGFGFWKSGYTMLMPWIWRWSYSDKPDYLAKKQSDCGFVIAGDGDIIATPYWESFRAGVNDGRYVYTLECAVKAKENNPAPECQALVKSAKELLQRLWRGVGPEIKHLDNLKWASGEFDSKCWEMALLIEELEKFKGDFSGPVPLYDVIMAFPLFPPRPGARRIKLQREWRKRIVEI